jgi:selenocysteine lyase/cysteine desulfurase
VPESADAARRDVETLLAEARALFDPAPNTIYLDAATYGLPPRPTVEAMHQAIDEWQSGRADWVARWDQAGERCRALFADLIGTTSSTIALLPTVSVGVGTIVASLQPGDEVLTPDDEFSSVLSPLLVQQQQQRIQVRTVPLDDLAAAITPRTRLVAFSLVQMHTSRTAALRQIVRAARSAGAQTLVDATHAIPFVPVADLMGEIDYLLCAAYKHLLCPRGVAFMHVAPERWDEVAPLLANWRSARDPYQGYVGGPLNLAPTAARFDVSLAWFSWYGGAFSLALLVEWQRQGLLEEPRRLARRLAAQLGLEEPLGSLVSVPVGDADAVRAQLAEAGIVGAPRATSVRLSTHMWNTAEQIDRAAAAIAPFTRVPAAT